MIIVNLLKSLEQRFRKQQVNRTLEPTSLMVDLQEDEEYTNDGREGSLAIVYELIIHKLLKLASKDGGNALDIACGSAQLICKIAKELPQYKFTAIDNSLEMIQLAKKTKIEYHLNNINFKICDILKLEDLYQKKSFGLITWNLAMHHIETKKNVIKIINILLSLLDDDGVLFIYDIERAKTKKLAKWFANSYNKLWGKKFYDCSYNSYLAAFTFDEFEDILKESIWDNYEHNNLIIGNIFQYACTKKRNNKVNKKPNLKEFWKKRDYYFLKIFFRNI